MASGLGPQFVAYRKQLHGNETFKINPKQKSQKAKAPQEQSAETVAVLQENLDSTRCTCGGLQHPVFSNCMGCGRIVCTKHGEGSCKFCGTLIVAVDSDKIPAEHLHSPEFQRGRLEVNELLKSDKEYQTANIKVHDLNSGWFEEAQDIYNDNREFAKQQWLKEEASKLEEKEVKRYDFDLVKGTVQASNPKSM